MGQIEEYLLNFEEAAIFNDKLFFWSINSNGIFSYSLNDGSLKCLSKNEKYDGEFLYNGCVAYKKKIFFAPFNSDKICLYEPEKNNIEYINLDKKGLFSSVFVNAERVYFWGFGRNNVKVMPYQDKVLKEVRGLSNITITSKPLIINNIVYFTIDEPGGFCELDLNDKDSLKKHLLNTDSRLNTISYADGYLWFSGDKKVIISWSILKDKMQEYPLRLTSENHDITWTEYYFNNSFIMGKYVYYLPKKANIIVRIEIDSGLIDTFDPIDGANGGSFIRISDEYGMIIIEGGDHNAICDIFVDKDGGLVWNNVIKISQGSDLEKYICWGSSESRFNTFNRFIRSLTH